MPSLKNSTANFNKLSLIKMTLHIIYQPAGKNNIPRNISLRGVTTIHTDGIISRLKTQFPSSVIAKSLLFIKHTLNIWNIYSAFSSYFSRVSTSRDQKISEAHGETTSIVPSAYVIRAFPTSRFSVISQMRRFSTVGSNPEQRHGQNLLTFMAKFCFWTFMAFFSVTLLPTDRTSYYRSLGYHETFSISAKRRIAISKTPVLERPSFFAISSIRRKASADNVNVTCFLFFILLLYRTLPVIRNIINGKVLIT